MRKFRFEKLGVEIEMKANEADFFDIRESECCVRISHDGKRILTVLQDSKIEILDIVRVICYKGRVVAFGDAFVEVGGMSRVFARDRSQVIAYQGAEVRASGHAKIRALDNSRVIATGRAKVDLEGESRGYKRTRSRVKMNKFDNRAAVFDFE
jgi:hypothetical protein